MQFLDHSFGQIPPALGWAAAKRYYQLQQAGNTTLWNTWFGEVIPEASRRVLDILGLPRVEAGHVVEWGHNSHELVLRLMASKFAEDGALRVLTTDFEFYSLMRQLNALSVLAAGSPLLEIQQVRDWSN